MDRAERTRRHAAGCAAEAAARADKTAAQQACREAAILAGGGTSAPGGGGGGGGGFSGSTGDAVCQVGAVGAGAAGSLLVFPAHMARRTRPRGRAPRSLDDMGRRRAISATRGLQRYIIRVEREAERLNRENARLLRQPALPAVPARGRGRGAHGGVSCGAVRVIKSRQHPIMTSRAPVSGPEGFN